MKNYTKALHEIGEYIRINIHKIEEFGLTLIEGKLSIIRELITQEEKRTHIDQFLFLHKYNLSEAEIAKYKLITPLSPKEKNLLRACTIISNAHNLIGEIQYPIEYIKELCSFIADEASSITLPDEISYM